MKYLDETGAQQICTAIKDMNPTLATVTTSSMTLAAPDDDVVHYTLVNAGTYSISPSAGCVRMRGTQYIVVTANADATVTINNIAGNVANTVVVGGKTRTIISGMTQVFIVVRR